jgi:outer membrane protein TolC
MSFAERLITYEEALQASLRANPTLASAALSRDSAEASLISSRGLFDPTFALNGGYAFSKTVGFTQGYPFTAESNTWDLRTTLSGNAPTGTTWSLNTGIDRNLSTFATDFGIGGAEVDNIQDAYTSNLTLSLSQELLKGHRMAYNMENITLANQRFDQAELTLEKTRQDTLAGTAAAYWNWVYLFSLWQIAEDSVTTAEEGLRVGVLKVQAGELAPVERTRLEAAVVEARSSALDARNSAAESGDSLLLLLGDLPGQDIRPATDVGTVPMLNIDGERAIEVALEQSIDMAISRVQLEQARFTHTNRRHAMLPSLTASAATGVVGQDVSAGSSLSGMFVNSYPFMNLSGVLSVPLGNRVARGDRAVALADVQTQEIAMQELDRSLRAQVTQQLRLLASAWQKMELSDANVRLAEEMLTAEEALFDVGRTILKDVLESRTDVDRTRAEAVRARTDYRQAQVELLRLQGQLDVRMP